MKTNTHQHYITPYRIGLLLCAVSMGIYLLGAHRDPTRDFFSQVFFLNYGISIIYLVILLSSKKRFDAPRPSISQACWINFVVLLTISAFSLNQEMNVFARFPTWLNVYTLLSIPLFLVFPFYRNLSSPLKISVLLLSGASLLLAVYMALYMFPLLPLSLIAMPALGISVHSFVPLAWLLVLLHFLNSSVEKRLRFWILPGLLLPLSILIIYLLKWQNLQLKIQETIAEQNIKFSNRLPDAIYLAQKLPADAFTEEILVSAFKAQRFWASGFMFDNEGSNHYHSPLSTIALGLFGDVGIGRNTVESILNIRRDYRHATARRLWTGISLSTSAVSTNIRLFPEFRLAYHEKTIRIHNDPTKDDRDAWFTSPTQEALYTFHVPDGSIVTSLSLWINGREEKSRLTTVQRADSAYTRIVGTERRDPAIVHWREGNTITVNIFPCTPTEDRQFKIGFTTPLKQKANTLQLENIWFEGPDARQAMEVTQILLGSGTKLSGDLPEDFELQADGNYIRQGTYLPYWQMKLSKPALSKAAFCFGGFKYTVQEPVPQLLSLDIKNVFLDLTSEWSKEEYDSLLQNLSTNEVFAWLPEKTKITAENKDLVWANTSRNKFSVPFIYDIEQPARSVIVTKTPHRSPILEDLKNSDLSDRFTKYLAANHTPLQVINIGEELSPFWRSLRELRLVNYNALPLQKAIDGINRRKLERFTEDTTLVVLPDSHLAFKKTAIDSAEVTSTAPDHLMRIFAYNDLLRKIGPAYFEKEKYENELFREAEEAYVVSPITAMIVLESLADYERMGIHENTNTLGNASVLGGGAVPEPHEWLLIGLVAFFILRHIVKQKRLAFPRL